MPTLPMNMTIHELQADPYFIEFMTAEVNSIIAKRSMRPLPPEGMRYKRDWYDSMHEKGMLNVETFLRIWPEVITKKAMASRDHRKIISIAGANAYWHTVKKYEELNTEEKKKAQNMEPQETAF